MSGAHYTYPLSPTTSPNLHDLEANIHAEQLSFLYIFIVVFVTDVDRLSIAEWKMSVLKMRTLFCIVNVLIEETDPHNHMF